MRMRKKPNLIPRMEKASAVLEREPEKLRGRWLEGFPECSRLYLGMSFMVYTSICVKCALVLWY